MVVSLVEQRILWWYELSLYLKEDSLLPKSLAPLENKLLCKVRDFSPISQTVWEDIYCNKAFVYYNFRRFSYFYPFILYIWQSNLHFWWHFPQLQTRVFVWSQVTTFPKLSESNLNVGDVSKNVGAFPKNIGRFQKNLRDNFYKKGEFPS